MRWIALLVALLAASPALAGSVGPMVMGGFHTEDVVWYRTTVDEGGVVVPIENIRDYEQGFDNQLIGNGGGGLNLVLGDRDKLLQGEFRFFYMFDAPQSVPVADGELIDQETAISTYRDSFKSIGVGTVGLTFGVFRAVRDKLKLSIGVHIGSGFLTADRTEFALAQVGPGVSYLFTRTFEGYVDVSYGLRYRKVASHGLYGSIGLRYVFD